MCLYPYHHHSKKKISPGCMVYSSNSRGATEMNPPPSRALRIPFEIHASLQN